MKFIDEAIVEVKAGDGGNGCVSFRREKHVPRGGPNGGDGGGGGDCILKAKAGLTTLLDLQYRKRFSAGRGEHGRGKDQFGKRGDDTIIAVPVGTEIWDEASGKKLVDLTEAGVICVVAKGGKGGHGNAHYVSATRQAPRIAQKGTEGEERKIRLELKLLADVGLIGFPNSGKSTLLSVVSNARPKIAGYPFTTKTPHLGLVRLGPEKSFVMADIPGLIEGAHQGRGMGIQFLKHIERTRVLIHLIDLSDPAHPNPVKAYQVLRQELSAYSPSLLEKPELIVLTKMDLTEAKGLSAEARKNFSELDKKVLPISAVKQEGLESLLTWVWKLL